MLELARKIRRGFGKPPGVILNRLYVMIRAQTERFRLPRRVNLTLGKLLLELGATSIESLWQRLANNRFPAWFGPLDFLEFESLCGDQERHELLKRAERAISHRVDLLGSGEVGLGEQIDWHTDFKTGVSWEPKYFLDIDYNNPDSPSDVKIPWELSRLQWLIPAGQAFLLTGDDKYAAGVRNVLEQWIEANPCGRSVNWACTMEAAMRIFTWVWFFHVFWNSPSWQDKAFQFRFVRTLFLHVEFTHRHIERSDVNGNHYTADASALVIGGLFLCKGNGPQKWHRVGWKILCEEIATQVYPDGVDFEASVPYHRLVTELFFWPAMYRTSCGFECEKIYVDRLIQMAYFSRAYCRDDGSVPLWGDADDARVLPFGTQDINDHRYLHTLVGLYCREPSLLHHEEACMGEVYWTFGPAGVRRWRAGIPEKPASQAFPDGGFYIMRGLNNHIFIDCGPVGLAGRGGHGHNDCLSFEAVLNGVQLITDCGAYLYTASYSERNHFRSTDSHNTPQVDAEEINRFVRPDYLWSLRYDALPHVLKWEVTKDFALFIGEHRGYTRLRSPVVPRRTILLNFKDHTLHIKDVFMGSGLHDVLIPFHFAPGVQVSQSKNREIILQNDKAHFKLWWTEGSAYDVSIENARVSRSYGVIEPARRLVFRRSRAQLSPCEVFIAPIYDDIDIQVRNQEVLARAKSVTDYTKDLRFAGKN